MVFFRLFLISFSISSFFQSGFLHAKPKAAATGKEKNVENNDSTKAEMLQIKKDIDELIAQSSCETDSECEALAFGAKPCGGPWSYLYFSRKTVDAAQLSKKVERYNELERKWNALSGVLSNCEMISPKTPRCISSGEKKRCEGI